jgi:thiamine biosynthesis lipoprotein
MARHVIEVMGTVFSVDIRDGDGDSGVVGKVTDDLRHIDATFSTYRSDSQISQLAAGTLRVDECEPDVVEVLDLCATFARTTDGYFTATPGGRLDPSGLVKGWAIARASALVSAGGFTRHNVNGGGDVLAVGEPAPGVPWRVGITHPLDRVSLVAVVTGRDIAVATSGIAERGHHIIDPYTGRPATELASVTVVGPDIVTADVYATAAVAMGRKARDWLEDRPHYAAFAVDATGETWATPGFADYVAT